MSRVQWTGCVPTWLEQKSLAIVMLDDSETVEEILLPRTKISTSEPPPSSQRSGGDGSIRKCLFKTAGQIPAILLIGMFHMMIGIPFGVSYFPIGWKNGSQVSSSEETNGDVYGPFPLPGKEALGIRMFLFSTIVGQVVFTFMSGFHNPIGLQVSSVLHACTFWCFLSIMWAL